MTEYDLEKALEIVRKTHPNARLAEQSQYDSIPGLDQPFDAPDLQSGDLDSLRRRYFGEDLDRRGGDAEAAVEIDDLDDPQQQMVDVEFDVGSGKVQKKTFIVSDDDIIGAQG